MARNTYILYYKNANMPLPKTHHSMTILKTESPYLERDY